MQGQGNTGDPQISGTMDTVRIKMRCISRTELPNGREQVHFAPPWGDNGDSDAPKLWIDEKQGATLLLDLTNPGALGYYKPGQFYFLDLTTAEVIDKIEAPQVVGASQTGKGI